MEEEGPLSTRHLLIPVAVVVLLLGVGIACRATMNYEIYSVAGGDTLTALAAKFSTTVDQICELNGISCTTSLRAGQSLAIPVAGSSQPKPTPQAAPKPGPIKATHKEGSIIGYLGTITVAKAPITTKPGAGSTLFKGDLGAQVVVVDEKGEYYGLLMVDGSTGWVAKRSVKVQPVELAATPPPIPTKKEDLAFLAGRPEVIQAAARYYGMPYQYGGSLPYSLDCSLLVQTAFSQIGVPLPRTAAEQVMVGTAITSLDQTLPGDRLYFAGGDGRVNHTGIYIGNGQFLHASSNRGMVAIDKLAGRYLERLVAIRRS